MKYKITVTEEQMRVMQIALEEYFRLRMGQDGSFTEDMASIGHDLSPENPNHERLFDQFIHRRNHLSEIMKCYFRICFAPYIYPDNKTKDMLIAEDLWDAIKCSRNSKNSTRAMQTGPEPSPIIEKEE